jgi:hypothetical protein
MTERDETAPQDDPDVRRVSVEIAGRLAALGVWLGGRETPDELVAIEEAVERFEEAVRAHGGDLMVDEGPHGRTTQPDDRHFALPLRGEQEPVAPYLERLERATGTVRRHRPGADGAE